MPSVTAVSKLTVYLLVNSGVVQCQVKAIRFTRGIEYPGDQSLKFLDRKCKEEVFLAALEGFKRQRIKQVRKRRD